MIHFVSTLSTHLTCYRILNCRNKYILGEIVGTKEDSIYHKYWFKICSVKTVIIAYYNKHECCLYFIK